MSFISTGVEYGLHCLLYLTATESHAPALSVRDLADLQGVPAEYLAKVFVEAIDGDKQLFECREIRERCAVFNSEAPAWATTGVCSIHAIMLAAEKRMKDELASHSLGELAAQVAAKAPATFTHQIATWLEERTLSRRSEHGAATAN